MVLRQTCPGRPPVVILAYGGTSRFHPSGDANLAEAVLASLSQREQAVFNLVDPGLSYRGRNRPVRGRADGYQPAETGDNYSVDFFDYAGEETYLRNRTDLVL